MRPDYSLTIALLFLTPPCRAHMRGQYTPCMHLLARDARIA
ncbi:hypothetical protein EDC15_102117 [Acetobacter aceti NBRC 14818]|nr:hypothetical protein EDC15_102117 [Acetobacter aceti NBRC 14818]